MGGGGGEFCTEIVFYLGSRRKLVWAIESLLGKRGGGAEIEKHADPIVYLVPEMMQILGRNQRCTDCENFPEYNIKIRDRSEENGWIGALHCS